MSSTEAEAVTRSIRRHLAIGMAVGLALIGAAGAWATTTQLAGAVVASGNFVVDSHVKKVQHPTGGVIGEILVEEGDWVKAGQVLMRLDPTQTKANLRIVTKRLDELMARLARLEAERDDRGELEFPTELKVRAKERAVASAINGESKLFEYRRRSREGRRSQLLERIVQLQHEIAGLDAQQQAYDRGLSILDAEIASLRSLHERGIVSVQRLNELETRAATFEGLRGEKIAQQAQAAGRIAETRLQILQIDEDLNTEVGRELREVQAQLGEFTERKIAAEDQLRRIDMLAPQGGIVHQLNVHTVGGVISPADVVMSIVPDSDRLAIEAAYGHRTSTRSSSARTWCCGYRLSISEPRPSSAAPYPGSPPILRKIPEAASPITSCALPYPERNWPGWAPLSRSRACRLKPSYKRAKERRFPI